MLTNISDKINYCSHSAKGPINNLFILLETTDCQLLFKYSNE